MRKLIDKITNNLRSLLSNPIDSLTNDFLNGNLGYRFLSDGYNFLVLSFSNKIPNGTNDTDFHFFFEYDQVAITVLIRDDSRDTFNKKEIQILIEEAIDAYERVIDHKEYLHLICLSFDRVSDKSKCVGDFLNSLCISLGADLITSPPYKGKLTDIPTFTINDHDKYEDVNLIFTQPLEKNEVEIILRNKVPNFPSSWDPSTCIKIQSDVLNNQYEIISMKLLCRWF